MTIKVWDGSEWQMASQIKVWDGSSWQNGSNANAHIWTGTTWQKIHPGVKLNLDTFESAFDTVGPPTAFAQAEIVLFPNGTFQTLSSTSTAPTNIGDNYSWLLTGVNSDYDVFVTNFAGDALTGSAPVDGSRVALSSTRNYTLYTTGSALSATFDLNICASGGSGTIIQTTSVSLVVDATSPL